MALTELPDKWKKMNWSPVAQKFCVTNNPTISVVVITFIFLPPRFLGWLG
jgi:hypothetical protein